MKRVSCEIEGKDEFEEKVRKMTYEYEFKALEVQLQDMQKEKEQLLQTRKNAKISILMKKFQNGRDILKAMKWLENNQDQFAGHVYDPLLIHIDVENATQNAKYLENVIPIRDIQAFAAENANDANMLMRQFREVMNLKVIVVQVDPNANMNQYQPEPRDVGHKNHQDFIGYLSNMISCPDPIKAYLCKLYQLHRIPVFQAGAERQVVKLVESHRLFFVGNVRYSVTKLNYGSPTSTSSILIKDRHIFQVSLDKARLKSIEDTKAKIESRLNNLNVEVNKRKVDQVDLEAKKKDVKYAREKLRKIRESAKK